MEKTDKTWRAKVPWGVIFGICLIAIFYVTAGVIAGYVITNAVAGATNRSASLFDSWWQVLLFVADVIFALLAVASLAMRILVRKGIVR